MRVFYVSTLFFFLSTLAVYCQPTPRGGGGLAINGIYNSSLDSIIYTDSLEVRSFILRDGKVYRETFYYQERSPRSNVFYLEPTNAYDWKLGRYENEEDRYQDSQQCLFITYRKDTMLIDFIGILPESDYPDMTVGYMDSIVVQPGYFKFYENKFIDALWNLNQATYQLELNEEVNTEWNKIGITPSSIEKLKEQGYLEYESTINTDFLNEENYDIMHFFKKGDYYLSVGEYQKAIDCLTKVDGKMEDEEMNCWVTIKLCEAYGNSGMFEMAIETITKNINCQNNMYHQPHENYLLRAKWNKAAGDYKSAIADYDSALVKKNYNDYTGSVTSAKARAMIVLGDYEGAFGILEELVENDLERIKEHNATSKFKSKYDSSISDELMRKKPFCHFLMGWAKYHLGDTLSAYQFFFWGLEGQMEPSAYFNKDEHLAYLNWQYETFDSLAKVQPTRSEWYLLKALVIMCLENRGYIGIWTDSMELYLEQSLKDIDRAEALGANNYRLNYYRSFLLTELGRHKEALEKIDAAIKQEKKDPRLYYHRFHLVGNVMRMSWYYKEPYEDDLDEWIRLSHKWDYIYYKPSR